MSDLVFYLHNGRTSAFIDHHCSPSRQVRLGKEQLRIALSDAEAKQPVDDLARKFVTRMSEKKA